MENRHGLCAEFTLHNPIRETESEVALRQIREHQQKHKGVRIRTIGADKAYHRKEFVDGCRRLNIVPHVACKDGVRVSGLDGRSSILSKTSNGPRIYVSDMSISFDRFKMSTVSRCLLIASYNFSSLFSSTLPNDINVRCFTLPFSL
jgi:hypothetical protein